MKIKYGKAIAVLVVVYILSVCGLGQVVAQGASIQNGKSIAMPTPLADFTISASPNSLTMTQGGASVTSTITVTSVNSFNSAVTLSTTAPSTLTNSFSPNPVTPPANGNITSTLTVSATLSATVGSGSFLVSGVSGSITHSVTITYTVNAAAGTNSLTVNIAGVGTVTSSPAGINCPSVACTANYTTGTVVTLTETPGTGQTFSGWTGGGCSGTATTCAVTVNVNQNVTTTFAPATGFLAYSGTAIVPMPATPNLGGLVNNGAVVTDTSYVAFGEPSANLAPITRCTDWRSIPNTRSNSGFNAGLGGSGASVTVNTNTTLLHVNTGTGGDAITMFNPATGVCGDPSNATPGVVVTTDKNTAGGGSSGTYADFGGGSFSLTNPLVWYAWGLGGTNPTSISQFTFCFTGGANCNTPCYTAGCSLTYTKSANPIADFAQGVPNPANTSVWAATHAYTAGDYINYTLQASEIWTWVATTAVTQFGDVVVFNGCAYKSWKLGTTGGTIPSRSTTCNLNTFVDGTVTWKGLGGPPIFMYQTTTTGTSGGTQPVLTDTCTGCLSKHPNLGSSYVDGGATWVNVGALAGVNGLATNAVGWATWAGSDTSDTRFHMALSTDTYGNASTACNNGNCMTSLAGGQGSGIHAMAYDTSTNIFHLLNTLTGYVSDITCTGGTGWNCAGGSWVISTRGKVTTAGANSCSFTLHNQKANTTGDFAVLVDQVDFVKTSCGIAGFFDWNPLQSVFSSTTNLQNFGSLNHWAALHNSVVALNDYGYGGASGVYMTLIPFATPSAPGTSNIIWQPFPCALSNTGPPYPTPDCTLGDVIDNHLSGAFNPGGTDSSPICGDTYNLATLSPFPTNAWQGEAICVPANYTWTNPATQPPVGTQNPWRFTHLFGMGTNDLFNIQFVISQYAQAGDYLFIGTDWNATFGAIDQSDPTCGGVFPCANGFFIAAPTQTPAINCIGGPPWQPSTTYSLGQILRPIQGTSGGGTKFPPVQLTAISGGGGSGTSGTTKPVWLATAVRPALACTFGSTAAGCYVDGPLEWSVLASKGNCRGDVVAVKLK